MSTKRMTARRKLLFTVITLFLLLLSVEIISRVYYYQRSEKYPIAFIQLARDAKRSVQRRLAKTPIVEKNKNQYLARPYVSKTENDAIARENEQSNRMIYQPWVQFSYNDFTGKYVNINKGVRSSIPGKSDTSSADCIAVYFLGGSTIYGYNITDAETIPSCFVKAYQKKYPHGKPIQVFNLGVPYYFSYQELMLLTDKIYHNQLQFPAKVIMLDGLNDCYNIYAAYSREPFFTPAMQQLVTPGDPRHPPGFRYDWMPDHVAADSVYQQVCDNYINTIEQAGKMAGLYGFSLYCFWQPVPFFQYPNIKNDPICDKETYKQFQSIYPKVAEKGKAIKHFFNLADMLLQEKGLPFIDNIHYSPVMTQAIAERMLAQMEF